MYRFHSMATATVVTEEKRPVKKRPRAQSAKFPRSTRFSYDSPERYVGNCTRDGREEVCG